jgi:hypothetical protein
MGEKFGKCNLTGRGRGCPNTGLLKDYTVWSNALLAASTPTFKRV